MALASMTGFARETGTSGPWRWAWELKTVNAKGLDVRVRVPPALEALAEECRAAHRQGDPARHLLRDAHGDARGALLRRTRQHVAARCSRGGALAL